MIYTLFIWFFVSQAQASDSFQGFGFYFGDLHVHTGVSGDGESSDIGILCDPETNARCGAVADIAVNAKANGLDFVAVADHVNGSRALSSSADFMTVQNLMLSYHDPANNFLTIPAIEAWFTLPSGHLLGHRNLYMFGSNADLSKMTLESLRFNGTSTDVEACESVWEFVRSVRDAYGPALLLPHHVAAGSGLGGDWSCFDQEFAPAVEVYSDHGNSMSARKMFDPLKGTSAYPAGTTVEEALSLNEFRHKIGFYGSTDNHTTMPGDVCTSNPDMALLAYGGGLAVVVQDEADDFTRLSVRDALLERRTYATSGPMLPVTVEYYADDVYVGKMGEVLTFPSGASLRAVVAVPKEHAVHVTEAQLLYPETDWKGGKSWLAAPMTPSDLGVWEVELVTPPELFYPKLMVDGESWYGEQDCDDGGDDASERIWLSPSWVQWKPDVGSNTRGVKQEVESTSVDSGKTDTDQTVDTEDSSDTEEPTESGLNDGNEASGCGCSSGVGSSALGIFLGLIVLAGRRREIGGFGRLTRESGS